MPAILYSDPAIVVLDKPAGLCVIPAREGDPGDCLRAQVEAVLGAKAFVVHRIDRETSGIVVMARTAEAHRMLNDAFARREVTKEYRALVSGSPAGDAGTIDAALARGRKGRMRAADSEAGVAPLAAVTAFRMLERFEGSRGLGGPAALVAFEPRTGRQHQIRVHAASIGCPILGDRLYAPQVVREAAPRLMLHALTLSFRHPVSGADMAFAAPIPSDFESIRQRLATV